MNESHGFEFASNIFYNRHNWLRAIAQSWLTADGWNDYEEINGWLNTIKPEQFATECLHNWFTGEIHSQIPTLEELSAVFAELESDRIWLTGL